MPSGPEVQALRDQGATVADGPVLAGQQWLKIERDGSTYYVAEGDTDGLDRLAGS